VGRRDSTSYISYPRHFADGGADAYWARFVRYRDRGFRLQEGDPARAAELLGSLDAAALRTFDRSTAAGTASLARRYAVEQGQPHDRVPGPGSAAHAVPEAGIRSSHPCR
jgi:hypothetical protein